MSSTKVATDLIPPNSISRSLGQREKLSQFVVMSHLLLESDGHKLLSLTSRGSVYSVQMYVSLSILSILTGGIG